MRIRFEALSAGALFAVVLGGASSADATTALFLPREELVQRSTVIARVRVGASVTAESEDGAAIVTRTELTVESALKGAPPTKLVVEQIGGTYRGRTERVLGDAHLVRGEDAVVFLAQDPHGTRVFTALAQAVYHVDAQGIARRSLGDLELAERAAGRIRPLAAHGELPEPVEHLMTDVVRLAGER